MLDFPSTLRNRDDIQRVLHSAFDFDAPLRILEVASGSGQHASYLARAFPHWTLQPTDLEPEHLASIEAYRQAYGGRNLLAALKLDAASEKWPVEGPFDAVWAINLLHISPWETTLGLFAGAKRVLDERGRIYLYGAYRREGRHTASSNEDFDRSLKQRNPAWGVRCLDDVKAAALEHGFKLERVEEMPSNNLSLLFNRSVGPARLGVAPHE